MARFYVGLASLGVLTCVITLAVLALIPVPLPGWTSTWVASNSMAPTILVGDVVVVREIDDVFDLDTPTVILADRPGKAPLLHRIEHRTDTGYVTKGDANESDDGPPVSPHAVLGVGRLVVPYVGYPAGWIQHGDWARLVLTATGLSALAWLSRFGVATEHDPWAHTPVRRPRRRTPARTSGMLLAVLALPCAATGSPVDGAVAALTSRSGYSANALTADILNPPTGVSVVQRCVQASVAPTFVGQSMKTFTAASLTLPAALRPGDLLVAMATQRDTNGIATPAGWTRSLSLVDTNVNRSSGL